MSGEICCTFLHLLTWGTFSVCAFLLVYLALTQRSPSSPAVHFAEEEEEEKKSAADKNTFLLNFKTTLMCAAANSLWLKNLPNFLASEGRAEKPNTLISEGAGSGSWWVIERTGSSWRRGLGGGSLVVGVGGWWRCGGGVLPSTHKARESS